jgi:hypothetical protein
MSEGIAETLRIGGKSNDSKFRTLEPTARYRRSIRSQIMFYPPVAQDHGNNAAMGTDTLRHSI